MSENTTQAACSQREWDLAREAGLPFFTTADERAIHAFAEAIRADDMTPTVRAALAELIDLMQGVIDGTYTPDSFTLQPARAAIAKAEGAAP